MQPTHITSTQEKNYKRLFRFLRNKKSSAHDALFDAAHTDVFTTVDCLQCANCCKTHSPIILQSDITRISKYLGISASASMSKYLLLDEDEDWVFHTQPCPFLGADNYCSIYSARPKACSEYPHTNRKRMYQIENITLKNAEICPAVTQILDKVMLKINA